MINVSSNNFPLDVKAYLFFGMRGCVGDVWWTCCKMNECDDVRFVNVLVHEC